MAKRITAPFDQMKAQIADRSAKRLNPFPLCSQVKP